MIKLADSMFAPPEPNPAPAPPVDPTIARAQAIADNTYAEEALNGFIAAKQHALFEAPDAYYRTEGSDAIYSMPSILDALEKLRTTSLDGLANDAQRDRLAPALDAHLELARGDVARHVAEQSLAWQRQTALDRIALLTKEAAFHHNDDDRITALGIAAENAARAHARIGDAPLDTAAEDAAAAAARNGVLDAVQQARAANGRDPNIVLAQATSNPSAPDLAAPRTGTSPQSGSVAVAAEDATRTAEKTNPGIDQYKGNCATAVINALKAGGYEVPPVPHGAKTMGPGLASAGFEEVVPSTRLPVKSLDQLPDGYTPRKGDVIVIDNPTSRGNAGHTAIYNGTAWVSDTIQRYMNPYPNGNSTISIYRHP
jgi:hypothetical protein